jgi:DNA polymerase III delta subunit
MLFVFHGTDHETLQRKADALVNALLHKRPDAARMRITEETFSADALAELAESQSLFGGSYIADVVDVIAHVEAPEAFMAWAHALSSSPNIVVVREQTLPLPVLEKLTQFADKVVHADIATTKPVSIFNVFQLGDSLYARDRKGLWVGFTEARLRGIDEEALMASLWYSVKALSYAAQSKTAEDAGLKSFPYTKAKQASGRYRPEEIDALVRSLFGVQQAARSGEGELSHLLERWVLDRT